MRRLLYQINYDRTEILNGEERVIPVQDVRGAETRERLVYSLKSQGFMNVRTKLLKMRGIPIEVVRLR